jgi:molecular chaperone HscB
MNYFELFEIPPQFEVDTKKLKPKFLELSRKFHPDFHTNEDEAGLQRVMEISSAVNKGWQVFQDPMATLQYVLEMIGSISEQENVKLSGDFLMEMMELNEQITDSEQNQLLDIKEKIYQYEQTLYSGVKKMLISSPSATSETDLEKIKEYYYQRKYLNRIQERIGLNLS